MTDNEKLIEEAAIAIHEIAEGGELPWFEARMADKEQHRTEARAALAVFEKAHTPTDNERADAEQRWPIPPNYEAGDPEHTLLIAQRQAYMLGRSDARTRSEVPEPIAEPKHDESCAEWCNHCQVCGEGTRYGSRCPEHYQNRPQGEPSDAPDLGRLEKLASAATPGPWMLDGMGEDEPEINYWAHRFIGTDLPQADGMHQIIATSEDGHGPNAEYIAASDPQTVLALIAALRAAGGVR